MKKFKIIVSSILCCSLFAGGMTAIGIQHAKPQAVSAVTEQTINDIVGFTRIAGENSKTYIAIAANEVVGDYGVSYSGTVYTQNGTALPLILKNNGGASGSWTNGGSRRFEFKTDASDFISAIGSGTTFYLTKDSAFTDGTKTIKFAKEYVFTSIYDGNCKIQEYVPTTVSFDIKEVQNRLSSTQVRVGVNEFSGIAAGFSGEYVADVTDDVGNVITATVKDAGSGSSSAGNRLVYLNLSAAAHGNILIIQDGIKFVNSSDLSKVLVMKNGYRLDASTSANYRVDAVGDAEDFANIANSSFACDATGATAPAFNTGYSWNILKQISLALDAESVEELKNYESSSSEVVKAFMAKYTYIVNKYGTSAYADFLNLGGFASGASNYLSFNNYSSLAYVLVPTLSLLTMFAFFLLKKKSKANQ